MPISNQSRPWGGPPEAAVDRSAAHCCPAHRPSSTPVTIGRRERRGRQRLGVPSETPAEPVQPRLTAVHVRYTNTYCTYIYQRCYAVGSLVDTGAGFITVDPVGRSRVSRLVMQGRPCRPRALLVSLTRHIDNGVAAAPGRHVHDLQPNDSDCDVIRGLRSRVDTHGHAALGNKRSRPGMI